MSRKFLISHFTGLIFAVGWIGLVAYFATISTLNYDNKYQYKVSVTITNTYYVRNVSFVYPFNDQDIIQIVSFGDGYVNSLMKQDNNYYLDDKLKFYYSNVDNIQYNWDMYTNYDYYNNLKYLSYSIYIARTSRNPNNDVGAYIGYMILTGILPFIISCFAVWGIITGLIYGLCLCIEKFITRKDLNQPLLT